MMFLYGYAFARCVGLRPWPVGLAMVVVDVAMVGLNDSAGRMRAWQKRLAGMDVAFIGLGDLNPEG